MYTPLMGRAGSRMNPQDVGDRDIELQLLVLMPASTSVSTATGTGRTTTDAAVMPVAIPADTGMGMNAAASHDEEVQIRMLKRPRDDTARCVIKTIDARKQHRDIVRRLDGIDTARCIFILLPFNALKNLFFMRRHTVWTAEVSLAGVARDVDVEDQQHGACLVVIQSESFHPELTCAIRHTGHLKGVRYVEDHLPGIVVTGNLPWALDERRGAVYLKREASKVRALVWLTFALAASAGVGLAVGLCAKSAALAFPPGAFLLVFLLSVQKVLYDKVN